MKTVKNLQKRLLLLILCCMLAATNLACLPKSAGNAAEPSPLATPIAIAAAPAKPNPRAGVPFSEMTYERPDTEAIKNDLASLAEDIAKGKDAETLLAEYQSIYDAFNKAESAMSLAYLLYAFDVTDSHYEEEYTLLQSELNTLDLSMTDVSMQLFDASDAARQLVSERFGESYMETVVNEESLNSEEIQELQDQELALVNAYNRAANELTVQDNGKTYTVEDITGMTDDLDEFYRLYDLYLAQLNAKAGEIFIEMLAVRSQIAEKLGYGSYAAYMYDCYGRDFTLQDAQTLHKAVKTYIVPVYLSAYGLETTATSANGAAEKESFLDKLRFAWAVAKYLLGIKDKTETGAAALQNATYSMEDSLSILQEAAADFSPNLYESLRYMLDNDLYDFSVSPKKMSGSFTTYISEYQSPFIFSQWGNDSASIGTVIHELGHFTNYYRNPASGWSSGDSLDLAEVDSQGLELLMIPYYERFYGDLAPYAERDQLISCMYALISGCMEDEFQQAIYANPDMTLDEINALYARLAQEYGFTDLYGYTGKEWSEISHTFQSPMYYISYAVSMVSSLELWRIAQEDQTAAKTAYFSMMDREEYMPFREVLAKNGLADVFDANTIQEIGTLLNAAMQRS